MFNFSRAEIDMICTALTETARRERERGSEFVDDGDHEHAKHFFKRAQEATDLADHIRRASERRWELRYQAGLDSLMEMLNENARVADAGPNSEWKAHALACRTVQAAIDGWAAR